LEALIMRAANLVFATTNSADLERLVEERGQFDWAIIEEAGKATGGELIMPLLLSHRRLMIGDHKQLPPYGADKLEALLSEPSKLRSALSLALKMIERPLKEGIGEDVIELLDDDDNEPHSR
jgi:superfamily I DNA and/or RNA helicase